MLTALLALALSADPAPLAPEAAREANEAKAAEADAPQAGATAPAAGPMQAEPNGSRTHRVPTTTVSEERLFPDARPVGPYRQPEWTARRRFPGTRVYVAPPGATAEWWLEDKTPFDGAPTRWRSLFELSFGLGHRLQLDLYLRTEQLGEGPLRLESERVELRWALADWGVLPGNPTLYVEWIRQTEGPMRGEVKLLFGGDLTERLYWGLNLFFERDLYGAQQGQEYGLNGGLSYGLGGAKLSLGAEVQVELADAKGHHGDPDSIEVLAGPSLAWRPVPAAQVLLVWFVGPAFERSAPADARQGHGLMQPTLVMGWRF